MKLYNNIKHKNVVDTREFVFIVGYRRERRKLFASRVYAQKYPAKKHPYKGVLKRLLQQYQQTKSLQ